MGRTRNGFIGLQKGPFFKTFEKLPTQRGGGRGRSPNLMAKNRGASMSSVVITLRLLDQNVFGGLPFRNQWWILAGRGDKFFLPSLPFASPVRRRKWRRKGRKNKSRTRRVSKKLLTGRNANNKTEEKKDAESKTKKRRKLEVQEGLRKNVQLKWKEK